MADNQQGSSECEAPTGRAKHYISGGCAGIASTMIVFPIKKTVFRQQVFGVRTSEAIRQLQRDGMRTLYRGLLPPLLEKTTSAAIMFGFYEDMSRWLPQPAGSPGLLTNSMAAVLAGTAEATMTPFNRVQALLQDQRNHSRFNNTFHTFRTLVRDYGVRELYRGMGPILLQNGPYNVLFFGLRGPMKRSLPVAETHVGHLVNDFICGGILGASLNFLFYPLKVLKARKQTQVGGKFQSSWQVLRTIWSERGGNLSHLYRGAFLNYNRSLLSWGITNAAYEFLKKVT